METWRFLPTASPGVNLAGRSADVEFDLEAIFDGELFADFLLLDTLCDVSRVKPRDAEFGAGSCWRPDLTIAHPARGPAQLPNHNGGRPGPPHTDDGDWPSDRLEIYIKEKPRGPGYMCDIVYHSEHLPVIVYAVLINRGQGLEVAELELLRREWGYFDEFDNYIAPGAEEPAPRNDPPTLITGDVLRRIPLGDIISRTERQLADDSWRKDGVRVFMGPDLTPDELTEEQRRALEKSSTIGARRRGRPELSDELLIDVAEAYIDEAGRGRGAIKRLADIYERPEATIRDWIAAARRRGFLASTKPGRRGAAPGLNLPSHTAGHGEDMRAGATAPNLSRARRRHILRMVEGEGLLDTELGEDARLLYVVGGLACLQLSGLRTK